ncbi:uncharacterized protein CEXT_700811 [Caerostris extrusa]|uniref:Uncharacterized protein n=1 Tax=Caerostris extrusa TaxID=172846 RepID=A0AAV4USE9_CAEEX|nr:uncharacterized protein CEXT_700811 [Caerostris extrusa]
MGVENQTSGQTSPPNRGRTPPQLPGYGTTTMPHSLTIGCPQRVFVSPFLQGTANVIVMWCGTHKASVPYRGKGFKPESSESDAESGRSAELIQKWQIETWRHSPGCLYTAAKRDNNSSPDNRPLYENIKPNKDDNRNEASLVYASLDLPNPVPQTRNGHKSKHNPPPRRDRTEYAEIQFPT